MLAATLLVALGRAVVAALVGVGLGLVVSGLGVTAVARLEAATPVVAVARLEVGLLATAPLAGLVWAVTVDVGVTVALGVAVGWGRGVG